MGDLAAATRILDAGAGLQAALAEDWAGVGTPNGGYRAAIALRAAGTGASGFRPASFSCQFLAAPEFGPIDIEVTPRKQGRRAAAVQVLLVQAGQPFLQAGVWAVSPEAEGFRFASSSFPDVSQPDELKPFEEAISDHDTPGAPVFRHLDNRPTEDWQSTSSAAPRLPFDTSWTRFVPDRSYADPFLDAGRLLVATDVAAFWPMSRMFGPGFTRLRYFAPNIDLNLQFHSLTSSDDWLLVEAAAESAAGGTVASLMRVWGTTGQLLATGTSTMLCRPNAAFVPSRTDD